MPVSNNVTSSEPPEPDVTASTADEIVTPPVTPSPQPQAQEREFPEVRKVESQERIVSPPQKSPQPSREKQSKQRKKKVPWSWLIGVVIAYAVIGFFSAPSAFALAVVGAWAGAVFLAGAVAWTVAVFLAIVCTGAIAWDGVKQLYRSRNEFQVFMILAGTSLLGIALGWLLYQLFPVLY